MKKLNSILYAGLPKIDAAFYGEGGVGKTTLLGQFHSDDRTGPTLWVNAQGNPQILEVQGIPLYGFTLEHYKDVLEAIDFMASGQSAKHPLRSKMEWPADLHFKSITVDTASYLQQRLMDYIWELSGDSGLKQQGLVQIEAMKHGAKIVGTYLDLTRKLLALPVHTFFAYQYFEKVNFVSGAGGEVVGANVQAQVQLYGSSRVIVPTWHNVMGLLQREAGIDRLTKKPVTNTTVTWRGPDKTGKMQLTMGLPEKMVNPTAKEILDAIEKSWQPGRGVNAVG